MLATALATLLATVLLAGCSGTAVMDEKELEEDISQRLTEQVGQTPDEIDCPEHLPAEEGARITCVLTAGADELDVEVEVDSVDGDQVNYSLEVAEVVNPS